MTARLWMSVRRPDSFHIAVLPFLASCSPLHGPNGPHCVFCFPANGKRGKVKRERPSHCSAFPGGCVQKVFEEGKVLNCTECDWEVKGQRRGWWIWGHRGQSWPWQSGHHRTGKKSLVRSVESTWVKKLEFSNYKPHFSFGERKGKKYRLTFVKFIISFPPGC